MRLTKLDEKDALVAMSAGADRLLDLVGPTLGPHGRAAVSFSPLRGLHVTSDGSAVADEVSLEDPVQQVGVRLLRDVASTVKSRVGDGTTTGLVLAGSLFAEAVRAATGPGGGSDVVPGLRVGLSSACEHLATLADIEPDVAALLSVARSAARGSDASWVEVACEAEALAHPGGQVSVNYDSEEGVASAKLIVGLAVPQVVFSTKDFPLSSPVSVVLLDRRALTGVGLVEALDLVGGLGKGAPLIVGLPRIDWQSTLRMDTATKDQILSDLAAYAYDNNVPLIAFESVADTGSSDALQVYLHAERTSDARLGGSYVARNASLKEFNESPRLRFVSEPIDAVKTSELTMMGCSESDVARLTHSFVRLTVPTMKERVLVGNVLRSVQQARRGVVPGGGNSLCVVASRMGGTRPSEESLRFGYEVVRRALERPLYWQVVNSRREPMAVLDQVREADGGRVYDAVLGQVVELADGSALDPVENLSTILRAAVDVAIEMLQISSVSVTSLDEAELEEVDDDRMNDRMGRSGRRHRHTL